MRLCSPTAKLFTASSSENPDLWRVLKEGGNNFGIVTRFTLRSFPYAPLWTSGIVTLAAFQYAKSLKTYHDYLAHASSGKPGAFDEDAAGPNPQFCLHPETWISDPSHFQSCIPRSQRTRSGQLIGMQRSFKSLRASIKTEWRPTHASSKDLVVLHLLEPVTHGARQLSAMILKL